MKMDRRAFLMASAAAAVRLQGQTSNPDPRWIGNGAIIPDEGYCDQPYIVITNDGNWLCVLTTGTGHEGQSGQHICATISSDKGKSWGPLSDIEPAEGPEASWVMPLKVPSGRVYAFYTYNRDNLREVITEDGSVRKRVDTLGAYMFKYSDDHGRTWSRERYEIPMRLMRIDRMNSLKGKTLFFWGVGKPIIHGSTAYFGFAKVGRWGTPGTMVESQGCFMRSDNILTEKDPRKVRWELLPDGDEGLRAPKGPISDEANLVSLSDGSLYATYRTIDGYNCQAYSRDGGHTWSPPAYATYSPEGRPVKHPRAANFVKKFSNGKFLLWFHNHGGEAVHTRRKWNPYMERNPAWILGGVEKNGHIYWSEPEILLYDDDPAIRISYPDFIEENGRYWVSQTQKTVARISEIDRKLLDGVWGHLENRTAARDGVVLDLAGSKCAPGAAFKPPQLPDLRQRGGFAFEVWLQVRELSAGQVVLDTRDSLGRGFWMQFSDRFTLELSMNDGTSEISWDTDPGTHEGTLRVNQLQHVVFNVDGGARILSVVVNGVFNDGGATRQFGWGRVPADFRAPNVGGEGKFGSNVYGEVKRLRIYNRYLRTAEAAGNFSAGLQA